MITTQSVRLFLLVILFSFSVKGVSMSFFSSNDNKKEQIVIFSGMEGQLLFNGKPAKNTEIKIWTQWKNEEGETTTVTTDDAGNYQIPVEMDDYSSNPLAQLVVSQRITAVYEGNEYVIWNLGKFTANMFDEFGGSKPSAIQCEITDDLTPYRFDSVVMETSCVWDGISELKEDDE